MKNKKCKREDCNKTFVTKDNRKMYCSRSCSAKVNNLGVKRHGIGTIESSCLNCHEQFQFSPSHTTGQFCSSICYGLYKSFENKLQWLNNDKEVLKTITRSSIRKYLIEEVGNKCSVAECKVTDNWLNHKITLIVDHIDGNAGNNSRNNVRLLCPNCNSQSLTFGNRNKGNGRRSRGLPLN